MPASRRIASLEVLMGLNAQGFHRDVKRVEGRVGSLEKRFGTFGATVKGIGAGLVGALSVGFFVDLAKSGLEYASSLGEVSQQLGVTTKDLQEYRYAATQVGVSQDEMDAGLAKLTKTLGQAAGGGKAQVAAFEQLGIAIRDAGGNVKSTGDLLPQIADALSKIPDPAQRAAAEVALFGKAGQKLEPLLAGGSKGVNDLRDAAQKLGIVLSDKQIQDADATADKIGSLKKVLEAQIAGTVANNAESILHLAEALGNLAQKALNAVEALKRFSNSDIGRALSKVSDFADYLTPAHSIKGAFGALTSGSSSPAGTTIQNRPTATIAGGNRVPLNTKGLPKSGRIPGFGGIPGGAAAFGLGRPLRLSADDVGSEFDQLNGAVTAGTSKLLAGLQNGFAPVPQIITQPFMTARAATVKEMAALRQDLIDATNNILDGLFPDEARIVDLKAQMAKLDEALAAQLISPERWFAARGRLAAQIKALEADIADAEALISSDELNKSIDASLEKISAGIDESLGAPVKKTTAGIVTDFANMADGILRSAQGLTNSIKHGDFFDILGSVLNLLSTVGQATGGFHIGPLNFPGAGASGGYSNAPGFATGGSFTVGGRAGIDQNLISFRASKGEMVDIRKPGQDRGGQSVQLFDLRGAVMTQDLMADVNQRIAAGEARSVSGGASLALRQMNQARSRAL